ncbi:LytTR family DNA-binding domain-containing protein [Olivibacter sp. SDN3]|uniref:LytR/AlgR family response regulator transcription factor n=1 Tax=Olivibacter sp. SDN3 TaxID=2764720 RepID=UPI001C9E23E0|nr:LytTR family DNA-binding domain-containing protein [Olivibacter sp. SDN3]
MMKLKCVITDDEPIARKGLQGYVEKLDFLTLAGTCEDALSLNTLLKNHEVDLLFLDIEMPYLSGIELLQSLATPPKVILTTAYEQYALKGYELEVIDYLLKPISFDRFLKAANKAVGLFNNDQRSTISDDVFVKVDGKIIKLAWQNVLFIEALENYVCIHTSTDKHIVHITMKSILDQIPANFIQVHKSSIVNITAIDGINGNILEIGSDRITVSRSLKESVMEKIINNKLLKR